MTQWAKAPRWSPAGPQELPLGEGTPEAPADPWGLPEIQDTGLVQQRGGGPMGHISQLPHPSGHPSQAGWGRWGPGSEGCGYLSSPSPLSALLWACLPVLLPQFLCVTVSLSFSLSHLSLSHLSFSISPSCSLSLFTSVLPLCLSPLTCPHPCVLRPSPCPSIPAYAAAFLEPQLPGQGHMAPSPLSSFGASSNCPSQLRGHMLESQTPAFPVPRGQASWSGSASGSRSRREGGSWSPAI